MFSLRPAEILVSYQGLLWNWKIFAVIRSAKSAKEGERNIRKLQFPNLRFFPTVRCGSLWLLCTSVSLLSQSCFDSAQDLLSLFQIPVSEPGLPPKRQLNRLTTDCKNASAKHSLALIFHALYFFTFTTFLNAKWLLTISAKYKDHCVSS